MYENHKLCSSLTPKQICLVVEQYKEGEITRKYHEHVPKYRLSDESRRNLLRALVISFSGMSPESIVRCYLNDRGSLPSANLSLPVIVKYPEPGVLRHYCGTNTVAWSDQVIVLEDFRRQSTTNQ